MSDNFSEKLDIDDFLPNDAPPGGLFSNLQGEAYQNNLLSLAAKIKQVEGSVSSLPSYTFPGVLTAFPVIGDGLTGTPITLEDSGVTPGTYDSVTVDEFGIVSAGTNPTPKLHAFLNLFAGGGGSGIFDVTQGADLTDFREARLHLTAANTSGSTIRAQYSDDSGATWHSLDSGTGPEVSVTSTGRKKSGWVTLVSGAKADVLVRAWDVSAADNPNTDYFQRITVELRSG